MAQRTHIELSLPDEDATRRVAERLAPLLGVGDVLLLSGEIGAGIVAQDQPVISYGLEQGATWMAESLHLNSAGGSDFMVVFLVGNARLLLFG